MPIKFPAEYLSATVCTFRTMRCADPPTKEIHRLSGKMPCGQLKRGERSVSSCEVRSEKSWARPCLLSRSSCAGNFLDCIVAKMTFGCPDDVIVRGVVWRTPFQFCNNSPHWENLSAEVPDLGRRVVQISCLLSQFQELDKLSFQFHVKSYRTSQNWIRFMREHTRSRDRNLDAV